MSVSAFPYGVIAASAAGVVAPTVNMPTSIVLESIDFSPGEAFCSISLFPGGDLTVVGGLNPPNAYLNDADHDTGIGGFFEARLTKSTGTDPGGLALNFWYSLGSLRSWNWDQGVTGIQEFEGTIEVREIANTGNIDSSSLTVTAEVL